MQTIIDKPVDRDMSFLGDLDQAYNRGRRDVTQQIWDMVVDETVKGKMSYKILQDVTNILRKELDK